MNKLRCCNDAYRVRGNHILFLLLLVALTSLSIVIIITATKVSLVGYSDSAEYFSAARNLASGHGLGTYDQNGNFTFLTIFAPLYPVVLSLFIKLGIDPVVASRVIDISTFAALVFLSGLFLFRASKSIPVSIGYAAALTFSGPLIHIYTSLMSEPLAITCGMIGFLLALLFVLEKKWGYFIVSGLLTGFSFFARYAFAAFPLACGLLILIFSRDALISTTKRVITYLAISLLPMSLWLLTGYLETGSVGARELILTKSIFREVLGLPSQIVDVAKYWLPYRSDTIPGVRAEYLSPVLLAILVFLVLTAFALYVFKSRKISAIDNRLFIVMNGFLIVFISYLFAVSFFYLVTKSFPLDERILSPLIPPILGILFGAVLLIGSLAGFNQNAFHWIGSLALTTLFVVYYCGPIRDYIRVNNIDPGGFASLDWRGKPIFHQIQQISNSAESEYFSNGPDVVLFYNNINPHFPTHSAMVAEGNDELVSTEKCRYYILFPPEKIDRLQRRPDPLTDTDINHLRNLLLSVYEGEEGLILATANCD